MRKLRFLFFAAVAVTAAMAAMIGRSAGAETPTSKSFHEEQKRSENKTLLLFFADWCPTCKTQKKVLAQLENELKGVQVIEVDYDKEDELKKELKVTHQSTFVSFYGPVESGRATGLTSPEAIKKYITDTLTSLTLKDQLRLMSEAAAKKIPPEKAKVIAASLQKLRESRLTAKALKVGQKMPDFTLKDARGKAVGLRNLRKKGPVVVSFYRGAWCPYCNAQLSDLQKHLPEIQKLGATLVAITPEKPDLTAETEKRKGLEFPILSDTDNKLATQLGLAFTLDSELKQVYSEFGIDLQKDQGNPDWKLPVPATYVVGTDGKVRFAFVDVDYTRRAESADILNAILEAQEKPKGRD